MSIKRLQQRLTQVGVIRLGEQRISSKTNKSFPAKLETFRVTSPSQPLIEAVAGLLGGDARLWQSPTGPQWEVITRATEIAVYVPPQRIDPNYELWGNKYRARMCDGETEQIRQQPCLCEAAARLRYGSRSWPDDGQFERTKDDCKPTTRLSLMIADIPAGVGTFKLESHGWNAAAELPTLAETIAAATTPIPAMLRLEQRESNRLTVVDGQEKVEPRKYAVPVLDFFGLFTPRQAFSGKLDAAVRAAIGGGVERQALAAAPGPATANAVPAADVPPPTDPRPALLARAQSAATIAELRQIWDEAAAASKAGFDAPELAALLRQRMQDAKTTETATGPAGPAEPVVDAEVEPDRDEMWSAIMRAAKNHGWNLAAVEDRYRQHMGHDPVDDQATGWKYTEFLTAVNNGQVK